MDNYKAIKVLEYTKTFDEFSGTASEIAINKSIKALEIIEQIKEIIREEKLVFREV